MFSIEKILTQYRPTFAVCGRKFVIDGIEINLTGKSTIPNIMQAFIEAEDFKISRDTIAGIILSDRYLIPCSERMERSRQHNVVKTISRIRIAITRGLPKSYTDLYDWLPYYPEDGSWKLYRIRYEKILHLLESYRQV